MAPAPPATMRAPPPLQHLTPPRELFSLFWGNVPLQVEVFPIFCLYFDIRLITYVQTSSRKLVSFRFGYFKPGSLLPPYAHSHIYRRLRLCLLQVVRVSGVAGSTTDDGGSVSDAVRLVTVAWRSVLKCASDPPAAVHSRAVRSR